MSATKSSTRTTIGGRELSVSNLEKVLFPKCGFTKGQLIDYYVRIGDVMLPHLKERPLTMKRFPDGVEGKSFFEKHIPSHAPDWVRSVTVPSTDGHEAIPYAMVNDLPTLAWAANLGTIEFHVPLWHVGRHRKLPANPDLMVFDLDPGEGTSIVECCVVADLVIAELAKEGMEAFAKTSGSKGLQLYASDQTQNDVGCAAGPRARGGAQARVRPSGPGCVQHAEVAAAGSGPHRLEPEPSGQDDDRGVLGAGHVRCRLSRRRSAARRFAPAPAGNDPALLRFTTDEVLRRVQAHGDLFGPLAA